jgi:hypothetical protein
VPRSKTGNLRNTYLVDQKTLEDAVKDVLKGKITHNFFFYGKVEIFSNYLYL